MNAGPTPIRSRLASAKTASLVLAVGADATLVRMVVVPAFMHVMGRWNWWAPRPLAWLHDRFGISEGVDLAPRPPTPPPVAGAALAEPVPNIG